LGVTGPTGPVFRIPEVPSNWDENNVQGNTGAPGDIYYAYISKPENPLAYNHVLYMYYESRDPPPTDPDTPPTNWKVIAFSNA
jgi:hypothetical protein